ncbi:hypothetical protein [Corynebacterium bovis]|uniref:Uncharacterized protein n=1 Tax=Corynebacterium bovis DSM 20582 = CIP 54.80 TaxID=927655 RepID=A0A8H9YBY7_9CORY|nr:hypothetical protein [Corynebacterium bovis]MBB3115839.1 hypothetical protein [Corynebacterium bovis DSM 20582 = CIP 54.80]MDH2456284.1 hypothetical protein [Corynebacterium bovis]MDK8511628.1 hypothetical protein [Corynebacterium bovis]QQC46804.1 hypothetical protein I6I09_06680 [Corynebacterium bovis]WJY78477.1 hypothetical protein CBOVI_09955 [Corynebacterium bovis DSM 20582 = CIP 54.80]
MYAWIWRHLPGPTPVRVIEALVLLGAVILLLMEVVFPWVSTMMPYTQVSV